MSKPICFLLAAILLSANSFAQTPLIEWQKSLGGTGGDFASSIQQTSDGGYIVAGYSGSNDGDVTGNHGNTDYWIVKLDNTGAIQWQKSLGGTSNDFASSIQQTSDGGYIVAGYNGSNNGDITGNHGGGTDSWVVKLDSTGTIQWQKSLGGTSLDYASSIQQTNDGGYIIAGESSSDNGDVTVNHGGLDFWVVKLDTVGIIQWQKSLGGTSDDGAYSIQQTSDEGYIVAGYSGSNDGDVTGHHGGSDFDYWVVKLSADNIFSDVTGNLSFGDVIINQTSQLTYIINNTGTTDLTVSSITYPTGFTGNWNSGVIAAGGNQIVTVTFAPIAEQNYSGVVTVNSNATSGTNTLAVSGNGIQPAISGNIVNVLLNDNDGSLLYDEFPNIEVRLLENGNLVAITNTDSSGDFEFNNLTGSVYSVVAIYTSGYTVQTRYDNIAVGSVVSNIKVPYDLIGEIKMLVNELQTQEFDASVFYNLVNYTQNANGYDETVINNTLTAYSNIIANHEEIVQALARLAIAQKALDEMSNDARDMCAEIAVSSFDLGESVYNLFTLKKKIIQLTANVPFVQLLTQLINHAFNFTSYVLEAALIQGCNYIQDDAIRAYTIATLQGVFDALRVMAEGGDLGDWTADNAKDIARQYATNNVAAQIYTHLYVPSTQYNVETAANNANQLNYSGTFDAAFDNVIDNSSDNSIVEMGHQNTSTTQTQIGNLRTISNVAGTTSQISQIAAVALALTGFGNIVNAVLAPLIVVATAVDAGASGWAIAKGANRTRNIKTELASATQQAYAFVSIDGQGYEVTSSGLSDAITDYNNQLTYINGLIAGNQRLAAINEMQTLLDLDSVLQNSAFESIMPIYAASPFASVTDFDDTLNNVIVNDFALSMQNRQAVGYALAAYILDSLTASVVTDLQNASNNAITANNQLSVSIDNVNNELTGTIVPPHVSVIHADDFPALNLSNTYPLQVKFKNVGTSTASDVYAKLELHDGFTTTNDSVYIGSLAQDAIDSLTFFITTPNFDTTSYYIIVFNSPNTSSDGFGRALVTNSSLVTGIKNQTTKINSLYSYPNPATQSIFFMNRINEKANYELYGALGNLLYSGTATQGLNQINIEGLANGIYYLQLDDGQRIYSAKFVKQ